MGFRRLLLLPVLLLLLLLPASALSEGGVLVFIEEGEGFTVENNGQRVLPGEDAVFTVQMERGFILAGTDYAGESGIETEGRTVTLTLHCVTVPTRVRLVTSTKYCTVSYDANGGRSKAGETVLEKRYSLSAHPRPNTESILFERDGCALIGWNTRRDGQGERIGLGSRVTPANGRAKLYAEWAVLTPETDFLYTEQNGEITLTGYRGAAETLVIPPRIDGKPVTEIASGAFSDCAAKEVVLPETLHTVGDGAFRGAKLETLTLYDSLETFSDASFSDCPNLQTLCINAVEPPFGYVYRKESVYADKAELLIAAAGRRKLVFYGGCSMWYNLDAVQADKLFGDTYAVVNMGLNGAVSSAVQLQIMAQYLEPGDVLFHTPETSSRRQLMLETRMGKDDAVLWAGIENNYDLFRAVDLRTVGGVFDSFCTYLKLKDRQTDYLQFFSDDFSTPYIDRYGSVPIYRTGTDARLADAVNLQPALVTGDALDTLEEYYRMLQARGVTVYVSYACVNMDAVPEAERGSVAAVDEAFRGRIAEMKGVTVVSHLAVYLFENNDFFDTNYHLCTEPAKRNTALWMRDLAPYLTGEGGATDAE